MSRADAPDDVDAESITLTREGEWYVAKDETTGVASQGKSRADALANLAEALELHERPVPEDEDVDEPSAAPWL